MPESQLDDDTAETVCAGRDRIGKITGDRANGFLAFDEDERLIETFETRPAARKAIFERHRGVTGEVLTR